MYAAAAASPALTPSGNPGRGECEKNFKQTTLSPAALLQATAATYIRTIGGVIPYQSYLQSAAAAGAAEFIYM